MEMDGHGGLMIIVDHPWRKPEAKSQERMVMCSSQDGETNQKKSWISQSEKEWIAQKQVGSVKDDDYLVVDSQHHNYCTSYRLAGDPNCTI